MAWYEVEPRKIETRKTLPKTSKENNGRKTVKIKGSISDIFVEKKLKALQPGDTVKRTTGTNLFGNNSSQVVVNIVDNDLARVEIRQRAVGVFVTTAPVKRGIRRYNEPLIPQTVETLVSKQNIYITGESLKGEVVIKWVDEKVGKSQKSEPQI